MKVWPFVVVGGVVVVGIAIAATRKSTPGAPADDDEGEKPPTGGGSMFQNTEKPIAVGEATDPKVAPLLAEIQALWDARGIDFIEPVQFYTMTKAPLDDGDDPDDKATRPVAVPARATWERTADFLATEVREVFEEVERRGGSRSDYRTGGYRPADYNLAVGGAGQSRHVDGDAVDIIPIRDVTKNTDILLMAIATVYLRHPNRPIGAGFYRGNGHIDVGHKNRDTWSGDSVPGKDDKYLARARQELSIA